MWERTLTRRSPPFLPQLSPPPQGTWKEPVLWAWDFGVGDSAFPSCPRPPLSELVSIL